MISNSTAPSFSLADRPIGGEAKPFIIGEIAQAHDGSLGLAHAYIDAVADAGADAVKFQTHIAAAESTPAEPWRVKFSLQDKTRFDYWKRMEFTPEQWRTLQTHAQDRGLVFLSSPFSLEAVELLERMDVPAWKIASGEVHHPQLLERILQTKKPVLLSSGMSCFRELDQAVEQIRGADAPLAVFQCTTAYPCPAEQIGLNVLSELRRRYRCPVGLSDHSATIYAGLAAVTLGAALLETHVTLSQRMFGPDTKASLTVEQLRQLVEGAEFIHRARRCPIDKDQMSQEMSSLRDMFGKSAVARIDIPAGTTLNRNHLALKKPGGGISARHIDQLVGRTCRQDILADQQITGEMFE